MKNLFRPLLVLTGCIVLASCVSQKQFKGLKTDEGVIKLPPSS